MHTWPDVDRGGAHSVAEVGWARPMIRWLSLAAVALTFHAELAWAYSIETLVTHGCHEEVTAKAVIAARAQGADLTVRPASTRDERALLDDLPFIPPAGVADLDGVTALLGVREPDLDGNEPTDLYEVSEVQALESVQPAHCLRRRRDDGEQGNRDALGACRARIHDELAIAAGAAAATERIELFLAVQGQVTLTLPSAPLHAGYALHAMQDAFTHTFRTADGLRVTTVLNFVDALDGDLDDVRDGPAHSSALDACQDPDPVIQQRLDLAETASRDLLLAAFAPGETPEARIARVDLVLDRYLGYQDGCNAGNDYCQAAELPLVEGGCSVGGKGGGSLAPLALVAIAWLRRRRAIVLAALVPATAAAADPLPVPPRPAPESPLAVAVSGGASLDRPAFFVALGGRYHITSRWVLGLDVEWNPWTTLQRADLKPGTFNVYGTLIRRFRMRSEHVWLRTSALAGTSTLLFDIVGASAGSTGLYGGLSLLGLEIELNRRTHLLLEPAQVIVSVPQLAGTPVVHRQYRLAIGLQFSGP